MPDARCTRGPVCKMGEENAHEHTGSAEAIRHSLRNGLTAYAALSSETNSSCLRRFANSQRKLNPVGYPRLRKAWHQQRAPGPHGFAVRNNPSSPFGLRRAQAPLVRRGKRSLTAEAALRSLSRATPSRPPQPALHVS